jgi:hypothetical protein
MRIKIEPADIPNPDGTRTVVRVFHITVSQPSDNGWGVGVDFKSYDAACRVANAISDGAYNPSGVVTLDYSKCLDEKTQRQLADLRRRDAEDH